MTRRARRFARQLQARFRLPVDLADERLSSHRPNPRFAKRAGRRASTSRTSMRSPRKSSCRAILDDPADAEGLCLELVRKLRPGVTAFHRASSASHRGRPGSPTAAPGARAPTPLGALDISFYRDDFDKADFAAR